MSEWENPRDPLKPLKKVGVGSEKLAMVDDLNHTTFFFRPKGIQIVEQQRSK